MPHHTIKYSLQEIASIQPGSEEAATLRGAIDSGKFEPPELLEQAEAIFVVPEPTLSSLRALIAREGFRTQVGTRVAIDDFAENVVKDVTESTTQGFASIKKALDAQTLLLADVIKGACAPQPTAHEEAVSELLREDTEHPQTLLANICNHIADVRKRLQRAVADGTEENTTDSTHGCANLRHEGGMLLLIGSLLLNSAVFLKEDIVTLMKMFKSIEIVELYVIARAHTLHGIDPVIWIDCTPRPAAADAFHRVLHELPSGENNFFATIDKSSGIVPIRSAIRNWIAFDLNVRNDACERTHILHCRSALPKLLELNLFGPKGTQDEDAEPKEGEEIDDEESEKEEEETNDEESEKEEEGRSAFERGYKRQRPCNDALSAASLQGLETFAQMQEEQPNLLDAPVLKKFKLLTMGGFQN
jgi:hypothetical protein